MARAGLLAFRGVSAIGLVRVFTRVGAAVDAEEVLDALRDLAVLAVDRLVGGQRVAGEGALLRHGGVGRRVRGAEELRHSRCEESAVLLQAGGAASQTVVGKRHESRRRDVCREWVSGPWSAWVMSISGLAGASVAGAQQSVVAAGSKECRSRGGERAGERNAAPGEMQCSGAALQRCLLLSYWTEDTGE